MNISQSSVLRAATAAFAAAILGCDPGDGSKELDAGRAAYEARDLKKAEKLLIKSSQLAPQKTDAFVYLARIKLDVGELEEARDWIGKAGELAQAKLGPRGMCATDIVDALPGAFLSYE